MKRLFILVNFPILVFSCKPTATEEQNLQYESCKKTLLENKATFIAKGLTAEKKDSLREYIKDLETNNLEQLISKLEVEPEHVNLLVYSICEKADRMNSGPSVEEVLMKADSLLKFMDSMGKTDSLRIHVR